MNPAQLVAYFDRLVDAPDAIPRLRRFILDLAVRGKLVEQNLKDGPAAELLKRIQAKKQQLATERRLRGEVTVTVIEGDESPFAIPASWVLVPFGDIMISRDGERIPQRH